MWGARASSVCEAVPVTGVSVSAGVCLLFLLFSESIEHDCVPGSVLGPANTVVEKAVKPLPSELTKA